MSMKVSNIKNSDLSRVTAHGSKIRDMSESEPLLFRRTLTELSQEMYTARLYELKEKIDEQGNYLSEKVDVREYDKYRKLIREFLDEVVSNAYAFSKEDAYAQRGRHRYLATVRIVDEKIAELGRAVMSEQADKIEILSSVDEIRGLLLDLMV